MKLKKSLLKIQVLLIFMVLVLAGCKSQKDDKSSSIQKVQAAKVTAINVPVTIKSFGNLSAGSSVNVKSQVSGEILKTYFDSASYVKEGKLLMEIDPSSYEAALENNIATYEYDKADYKLKKYYVEKNKSLVKSGAYSKQDYQKLIADLEMAEAKLKVDKANIDSDKINLEHCYVKAPISGTTGISNLSKGDYASLNDTLLDINDNSYLYIDFPIPESNYSRIKNAFNNKELSVKITTYTLNKDGVSKIKRTIPATIDYLNNTTDSLSSTITLEAKIDNKDGNLLPEQFAYVTLTIGELKNAEVVPTNSIQTDNTGNYIYVIGENNKVVRTDITPGLEYKNYTVINAGKIDVDNLIVTVGAESVAQNSKVEIIKTEQPA